MDRERKSHVRESHMSTEVESEYYTTVLKIISHKKSVVGE